METEGSINIAPDRTLASIVRVTGLSPIAGADRIEIAQVICDGSTFLFLIHF
jgi:hypothetical protein